MIRAHTMFYADINYSLVSGVDDLGQYDFFEKAMEYGSDLSGQNGNKVNTQTKWDDREVSEPGHIAFESEDFNVLLKVHNDMIAYLINNGAFVS